MADFVAEKTVKKMIESNIKVNGSTVLVMGVTFKENVPDMRNSKVLEVINKLKEYHINVKVVDPVVDIEEAEVEHGIILDDFDSVEDVDAIILAVDHNKYKEIMFEDLLEKYDDNIDRPVLIDVKSVFGRTKAEKYFNYWRL